MSNAASGPAIRLRGVRHNNLKNFDLDLPLHRLIVITGLSGSGKSSLAFDTLFAEGQRRYIETFSPYARQFFDRMDKPQVDSIEGIPPAIAIQQRNAVRTPRSTVGTMTEICDHLKLLWPQLAELHCRQCGQLVRRDSPQQIWQQLRQVLADAEVLVAFDLPLSNKLALDECLHLVAGQGYQRLLIDGRVCRVDEAAARLAATKAATITVVQDRLRLTPDNRARFVEAGEQAYHFGKGKLSVWPLNGPGAPSHASPTTRHAFSNRRHCATCDIEYREPTPALFSFNHPLGACPTCRGFGRTITINFERAIPDRTRTLAHGAVKPWQSGVSAECQDDLMKFCKARDVPVNIPFHQLSAEHQHWVIDGDADYGIDDAHQWPYAWYGVKGYFRWLESKAYKMHVRVLLSRYRSYQTCPDCQGQRLQPDALLYRMRIADGEWRDETARGGAGDSAGCRPQAAVSLADFYELPIQDALAFIDRLAQDRGMKPSDPLGMALGEVRSRLAYLVEVGLGYLTLDRPTRTLSGGETERVNLTACLGTRLVNTLFVLDEPSVGLHPRDTARLVSILQKLRDAGNTVVVVEHEAAVIRAADQVVDLGPGSGEQGGRVIFQGGFAELLSSVTSLTGRYLSGQQRNDAPPRRPVRARPGVQKGRRGGENGTGSSVAERVADGAQAAAGGAPAPLGSYGAREESTPAWQFAEALPSSWPAEPDPTDSFAVPVLAIRHAARHNLKDLSVDIPLGRLVCITGVSGSGKTSLVKEVLLPGLQAQLAPSHPRQSGVARGDDENEADGEERPEIRNPKSRVQGWEHLSQVVLVDQSPLGRTPRSNPAVYLGAFDHIRELFARSEAAQQRGLNASAFSFNSVRGQCERCRGAGFEKIEMQFLSDVFIRCPDCDGRRYRPHILEVILSPEVGGRKSEGGDQRAEVGGGRPQPALHGLDSAVRTPHSALGWSIADLLDATVDEAVVFLAQFSDAQPAHRAVERLHLLQAVGLGYLRMGQPINTLSGGESQRLKLVGHWAESLTGNVYPAMPPNGTGDERPRPEPSSHEPRHTLFLLDEPTTGLHFDDVRVLLRVLQGLVDAGHSVVVIEHNLMFIECADWVIDLGPEAGDAGGQIVAQGTPEEIAGSSASHTGQALVEHGRWLASQRLEEHVL